MTPTVTSTSGLVPSPTPTTTITPSNNASCISYYLGPNSFSTTYEYVDCSTGITTQIFVQAGANAGPVCSRTTPTGGRIVNLGACVGQADNPN
jgi:hypothetical protein